MATTLSISLSINTSMLSMGPTRKYLPVIFRFKCIVICYLLFVHYSDLYQRNAILTFSCSISGNEFIDKQLRKYSLRSRNLLKIDCKPGSDLSTVPTIVGNYAIIALWQQLGQTEHDFPTFTIDMTYYSVIV